MSYRISDIPPHASHRLSLTTQANLAGLTVHNHTLPYIFLINKYGAVDSRMASTGGSGLKNVSGRRDVEV